MALDITTLWKAPEVNPINKKARSIPVLNPFDMYGRVFLFSWLGFLLAFWAWYTFPPLLTLIIKKDLHLTSAEVANSTIMSLLATFLLRFLAGPLCDQFGPRQVFASLLLIGCLPIGLAPLVKDATGLYISRFFIGVLGATFVPCQVWCTGFFDKNVVGTANALSGGWGNAGGGVTYFIMPAVFDALVAHQGLSTSTAWRVTFVVPLAFLLVCGTAMFLLCPDTPLGPWNERSQRIKENLQAHGVDETAVVDVPGGILDRAPADEEKGVKSGASSDTEGQLFDEKMTRNDALAMAHGEMIVKPSFKEALPIMLSPQTLFHVATYACSFGCELTIDSVLSAYLVENFPHLNSTKASNYAAIYGFLNFVMRPMGGILGDVVYNKCGRNLWLKKGWITLCGLLTGAVLIFIGLVNPSASNGGSVGTLVGLTVLLAVFDEGGNGANFALVPHVHPSANGIVSGLTGGGGNLGGIIFAVMFRFMGNGSDYAKGIWLMGVIHIVVNLAVCWIPPLPKGQVGGR